MRGVYKRVICQQCQKCIELRGDDDKQKKINCSKCGQVISVGPDNSAYYIDFYSKGRRVRERVGASKALAEAALCKRTTEVNENRYLDIRRVSKVRFEDFADKYLEGHCKVNHQAYEKASGSQLKMLKKSFSGKFLDEITPQDIEKYKGERIKKVTPATVNRCLARLKAMYNVAIKWKVFEGRNPVNDVKLYKEDNHQPRYLTKPELEKLLSVSNDKIKAIITVAVNTGMRRAEIFGLKWRDVNFQENFICLLKTKSGKKRYIPLNEVVKNALIAVRKHPQSDYIFHKDDGQPLKDIRSIFGLALERAGIKNCRFHDLRHTFASHLAMNGVDFITLRELMGHADLKTTLIYAHLSQDHKKRAVNSLCALTLPATTKPEAVEPVAEMELAVA